MRVKAKVYFTKYTANTAHPVRMQAIFWDRVEGAHTTALALGILEQSASQVGGTAHVSRLSIPGWVYFESCADANTAVRETERNAESEVYPGLKRPQ